MSSEPFTNTMSRVPDTVKVIATLVGVFLSGFGVYAVVQTQVGLPTKVESLETEVRALRSAIDARGADGEGVNVRLKLAEKAMCDPAAVSLHTTETGTTVRDRYCAAVAFIHEYGVIPQSARDDLQR